MRERIQTLVRSSMELSVEYFCEKHRLGCLAGFPNMPKLNMIYIYDLKIF